MKNAIIYLRTSLKAPALFILKLLILHFLLKLLFFGLNPPYQGSMADLSATSIFRLLYWSCTNDLYVILLINVVWFMVWQVLIFFKWPVLSRLTAWIFLTVNWLALILNAVDIFYVHFHHQRANADLLYVAGHPFYDTMMHHPWWTAACCLLAITLFYLLYHWFSMLNNQRQSGWNPAPAAGLMLFFLLTVFLVSPGRQLPTYPLIRLSSQELQYVQNSFHSFLYSIYRNRDGMVVPFTFLPDKEAAALVSFDKQNVAVYQQSPKKNIVLFIMESIPEDFFDEEGRYKVSMPFLDSIRQHSIYFNRAYSYSHNSNKGIVAILAGLPTITEIPLYHSGYTGLPLTPVGKRLSQKGYRSMFFIGDDYDAFGFAKCSNWLGFQDHFSREQMPGSKKMETHTMGLHDQYVLNFMQAVLQKQQQPFFAVHYNTSTHYPNDLPASYKEKYPDRNFSDQMKSMSYYNECLKDFFNRSAGQAWFQQSIFIFCSDHWMYPDARSTKSDVVQSFRIPLMIYDPLQPTGKTVSQPVSQLDVMNTVLAIAGDTKPFISYGENLLDDLRLPGRVIYSRENAGLYQAFNSQYVLGFNAVTQKTEFVYHISNDPERKRNLVSSSLPEIKALEKSMKAFLQQAAGHHLSKKAY